MTVPDTIPAPAVDGAFAVSALAAFAELTEPGDGITRLAFTPLERRAHAQFADRMRAYGCTVRTDAAGNTIAERPGTEPGLPALGTGSHLDSVPTGGRFDGTAGVVAAMAVAKALHDAGHDTRRPWRFVAFAAEEGARFGQACNGSRMIAGSTGAADLDRLVDADGVTMADAMRLCGLRPADVDAERWRSADWHAFVELHIEQGVVLESEGLEIGVVDTISGSTRLRVQVHGTASHSGGTPMELRKDALVTAAACVLACDELARDVKHDGTRITVGRLVVRPGSITTIPGEVEFSVDVRDVDGERQRSTAAALGAAFERIAAERGTTLTWERIGDISPRELPAAVGEVLAASAAAAGLGFRRMPSGASHDSQQVDLVTPTGMIFVPSREGLSHMPEEYTSDAQFLAGVRVLLGALLRLDAQR